jgi:hypothetical protein
MNITWPENALELLQGAGTWAARYPSPFYAALTLAPEFARDEKIHTQLVAALAAADWGARSAAAAILLEAGDPLGILHLAYNSLTTHPQLNAAQPGGWPNTVLLRHAAELTPECVELLLADLAWPGALRHVDLWAALPQDIVVPRMQALLEKRATLAIPAAYVLAMKGNDDGRRRLNKLVAQEQYLDLALIALSHIPDHDTMLALRAYASPKHPIYSRTNADGSASPQLCARLLRHAQCRRFLLDCTDPYPVRRTMEHFYLRGLQEMLEAGNGAADSGGSGQPEAGGGGAGRAYRLARGSDARFFVFNSQHGQGAAATGVSAPDLLCEFSDAACQAYCAEHQRNTLRAWLAAQEPEAIADGSALRARTTFLCGLQAAEQALLGAAQFPGLHISYEAADYERAAVGWILAPARHRFASYVPE